MTASPAVTTPTSTHSRPLLAVEGLTTTFTGGRSGAALIELSLSVARGETLGLVGESGCGKSMTALSILRLVPPPGRIVEGAVWFEGRNLLALSEGEMERVRGSRIGLVFQEPATALNPVFTIGDQLVETLRAHSSMTRQVARARAVELLADVSIPEPERRVDEYAHQLSGGLSQRALIALALAGKPSLLIADEPTTALDATVQAEVLELLAALKTRHGLALLLITHDLGVVAQHADRVAVMYAGRIVEHAPVRDLFDAPAHPYTRGLLASIPGGPPGSRLLAIDGAVPSPGSVGTGCAFAPRCPDRLARCAAESPNPVVVGARHEARCFLHGPSGPGGRDPDAGRE